jgi:hypothetical protein
MNRGRVGKGRGGKETDGCPLTILDLQMVELIALRACLAQLEAAQPPLGNQGAVNQPEPPPIDHLVPPLVLHIDLLEYPGLFNLY